MMSKLDALKDRLARVRDLSDALHQLAFSKYLLDSKNKSLADGTYNLSQEINSIYWDLTAFIYREAFPTAEGTSEIGTMSGVTTTLAGAPDMIEGSR